MKHNDRSGTAPLAAVLVFCILFSLFGGLFPLWLPPKKNCSNS